MIKLDPLQIIHIQDLKMKIYLMLFEAGWEAWEVWVEWEEAFSPYLKICLDFKVRDKKDKMDHKKFQ